MTTLHPEIIHRGQFLSDDSKAKVQTILNDHNISSILAKIPYDDIDLAFYYSYAHDPLIDKKHSEILNTVLLMANKTLTHINNTRNFPKNFAHHDIWKLFKTIFERFLYKENIEHLCICLNDFYHYYSHVINLANNYTMALEHHEVSHKLRSWFTNIDCKVYNKIFETLKYQWSPTNKALLDKNMDIIYKFLISHYSLNTEYIDIDKAIKYAKKLQDCTPTSNADSFVYKHIADYFLLQKQEEELALGYQYYAMQNYAMQNTGSNGILNFEYYLYTLAHKIMSKNYTNIEIILDNIKALSHNIKIDGFLFREDRYNKVYTELLTFTKIYSENKKEAAMIYTLLHTERNNLFTLWIENDRLQKTYINNKLKIDYINMVQSTISDALQIAFFSHNQKLCHDKSTQFYIIHRVWDKAQQMLCYTNENITRYDLSIRSPELSKLISSSEEFKMIFQHLETFLNRNIDNYMYDFYHSQLAPQLASFFAKTSPDKSLDLFNSITKQLGYVHSVSFIAKAYNKDFVPEQWPQYDAQDEEYQTCDLDEEAQSLHLHAVQALNLRISSPQLFKAQRIADTIEEAHKTLFRSNIQYIFDEDNDHHNSVLHHSHHDTHALDCTGRFIAGETPQSSMCTIS